MTTQKAATDVNFYHLTRSSLEDTLPRLLTKTLEPLNEALAGKDCMIGALSGVDFMLGHACHMARRLDCMPEEMTHLHAYMKRLEARPAFAKGIMT